jgi:hypothetical protein
MTSSPTKLRAKSLRKTIYSSYDTLVTIGKEPPPVAGAYSLLKTINVDNNKVLKVWEESTAKRPEKLTVTKDSDDGSTRKRKFAADDLEGADDASLEEEGGVVERRGRSIHGLLRKEKTKTPAKLRPMIFTNGEHVDLEHYLHSFVEGAAEKERSQKLFRSLDYSPSDSLIVASINCFSRKLKRNFFRDALYLCKVFANEMKMSLSCFLRVRGWLVVNHEGVVKISYRRVGDCLRLLGLEAAMNYYRVSAMMDRLFRALQSRDVFPEMPFEAPKKGTLAPNLLFLILFP